MLACAADLDDYIDAEATHQKLCTSADGHSSILDVMCFMYSDTENDTPSTTARINSGIESGTPNIFGRDTKITSRCQHIKKKGGREVPYGTERIGLMPGTTIIG